MKSLKKRRWILAALTVLAGVAGVAAHTANAPGARPADPWSSLRLTDAMEIEHYSDPLLMRDASDLVVVGNFTGFSAGRTRVVPNALGPGQDDQLFWVNGNLLIEEVINGTGYSAGQSLTVEFF